MRINHKKPRKFFSEFQMGFEPTTLRAPDRNYIQYIQYNLVQEMFIYGTLQKNVQISLVVI